MTDFNKVTDQFVQTIVDGITVKLKQAIQGAFGQGQVAPASAAPVKRGPGRPAGSKNRKPEKVSKPEKRAKKKTRAKKIQDPSAPKRGPGRPKKVVATPVETQETGSVGDINFFGDKSE